MSDHIEDFTPKNEGFFAYPLDGWRKAAFQVPVHLWRLGLAPVLGKFMMLITHTGRKSGLPRRTMTESYRMNDRYYAPCAFGKRAQWYKNMMADPRVTIQTAQGAQGAIAVRVTHEKEILEIMEAIKNRSQSMYDMYLDYLEIRPVPEDILAKKDRIYWIRFDPTDAETPPPLEADLVWIWPAGALILTAIVLLGWLKRRWSVCSSAP